MNCPSCSNENPDGAAFCMKCGTPQKPPGCPDCGADRPEGAAFCMKCGHRFADSTPAATPAKPPPPAPAPDAGAQLRQFVPEELLNKLEAAQNSGGMEGERRTVTMLFCDVQGSTAAAEQLDPEEWADIMNGAFEHLIAPVYEFEGTLARLMGDAILAFFGAPIGHEDDPERAVRAALGILESIKPFQARTKREWGLDLAVRVGINTGLVVVGAVGSDLRVEYTAMGDAVNTASRMESTAAPNSVQISETTHKLVAKLFDFEDLGGIEVKGKSAPVPAYRVIASRDEWVSQRGIDGLSAPLIGRDDELKRAVDSFQCIQRGRGRVVSFMGEAGLGKSRLVSELKQALSRSETMTSLDWHEGRCLSYETAKPFAPFHGVLESFFHIRSDHDAAERWQRVLARTRDVLPQKARAVASFVGHLLNAELPESERERVAFLQPPDLRAATFSAVLDLLEAAASTHPTVLVFEDLHWVDSASLDLLLELLEVTERAMLMIVAVFRPRRQEPSWKLHERAERDHEHRYTAIRLMPLGEDDARTLVSSILTVDDLPTRVRDRILAKAEGNPFFVEEVIRTLLDSGLVIREGDHWKATQEIVDLVVPDTLAAVLNTRLDALDDASKHVLQTASVIGREFRYDELAAISSDVSGLDETLRALERKSMLRETARVPQRAYRFKHALTRDATYDTVLLKRRRQLHAEIAEFMVRLQPDRHEDLAHHFDKARRPDRALPHLVAAGERAAAAYSIPEAIAFFERAIMLLEASPDPDLERRALEGLGGAQQFSFDIAGAEKTFDRLAQRGAEAQQPQMRVSGLNKLGLVRGLFMGRREEGLELIAESEQLARGAEDDAGLTESCMSQCYLRTGWGEFDEVERYMAELRDLGGKMGAEDVVLFGMVHLANTLMYLTRFDDALPVALEALERADKAGNRKFQAELLSFGIPTMHMRNGDMDKAMSALEQGLEIANRIGDKVSEGFGSLLQAKVALMSGTLDSALALHRRARDSLAATGVPYLESAGHCAMGTCFKAIGQLEDAAACHKKTLEVMDQPTGSIMGAMLWSEVGQCCTALNQLEWARDLFHKAMTESTAPMYLARPDALIGLVTLALVEGKIDEAEKRNAELEEYVTSRGMKHYYARLPMLRANIAEARGDHQGVLDELGDLEPMLADMGMRMPLLKVRSAQVRALRSLGRTADATERATAAQSVVDEVASTLSDAVLRDGFREASMRDYAN
jgi:class 3 adenylate cyclase/tetratricopeptide (TPR) repeat protein